MRAAGEPQLGRGLEEALRGLVPALRRVGMEVNAQKCGSCAPERPPAGVSREVPFVADRDKWSYLGIPLCENSSSAFSGVIRRLEALTAGLTSVAGTHPRQALQLLRSTMGACRVEYLLQSLPQSNLLSEVVESCELGLRKGLVATLGT